MAAVGDRVEVGEPAVLDADDVGGVGEAHIVFGAFPSNEERAVGDSDGDFFYLAALFGLGDVHDDLFVVVQPVESG